MKDKNVEEIINKYKSRASKGYEKYGVTTERNDLSPLEWLTHLQEELMDATIYIEKLKKEFKDY